MADIGTAYIRVAPNMSGIQGKIAGGLRGSGTKFAEQFGGEISGRSAFVVGAIAGIASAATNKAVSMITSSIGGAIKRVDTLNNSAKTFEYMGFAAEDTAKATDALEKSIMGLPTPLDGAMRGMTSLAATYGDVDRGQKVFTSLNNAILGFGGSAAQVENAIAQVSQLPLDGPLDAQTWNSLRNSGLTPVLVAMAKESGMSVAEMKTAFGEGQLTVQDFTDKLTEMNTEGGGGLESLEKIAQNATGGIGTGFANMQTAVVRGVGKIIQSVGSEKISKAIAAIGVSFEKVLSIIADNIPKAVDAISKFVNFIVKYKDIFGPLAAGIGAVVLAITAWKTALAIWSTVTKTATAIQAAFNVVMAMNPITLIILAVIALVAALVYFFTQTELGKAIIEKFGQVVSSVWEAIKTGLQAVGNFFSSVFAKIKGVVMGVINWIKSNWQLLLGILLGPIGLAVALIVKHWGTIRNAFSSAWNFVKGLWGRAGEFFSNIFNNIKNAFSGIANIGKDIVKGLWNGISSMGNWIKDKLISFVKDKIPGPVKKALGISSPSKVFAEFGRNIDEGLIKGVNRHAGRVESAVNNMANSAMAGMAGPVINPRLAFGSSSAFGGSGSGSGNTTNQSVNIDRVVLGDESAVREFFNQLNQDTINVGMGLTPIQGAQ